MRLEAFRYWRDWRHFELPYRAHPFNRESRYDTDDELPLDGAASLQTTILAWHTLPFACAERQALLQSRPDSIANTQGLLEDCLYRATEFII